MSYVGKFTSSQNAIIGHSRQMRVLSDNIVNQNTPGAKQSEIQFETLVYNGRYRSSQFHTGDGQSGASFHLRQNINLQGQIYGSARPLDLAIEGSGFFMVRDDSVPDGKIRLTRNGQFRPFKSDGGGSRDTGGNTYIADNQGHYLLGWQASGPDLLLPDAAARTEANLAPINVDPITFSDPGKATEEAFVNLNIPNRLTYTPGDTLLHSVEVVDSNGAIQRFNIEFTPTGPDSNDWQATISSADGTFTPANNVIDLVFDANGILQTPQSINLAANWDSGASSNVNLNIAKFTSFGDGFVVNSIDHDGRQPGQLRSYSVDTKGFVTGTFDNGYEVVIAQIPIGDVVNRSLLSPVAGSKYELNDKTGTLNIFRLDENQHAFVHGSSLEDSTADIADSFSKIIITQRAYSAALNAWKTIDETTQIAIGLKR